MRVLVTGGTEFVGCHTVAALVGYGHQVRLLVRARERIAPALDPLGIAQVDAVVGDVTSAEVIEQAMRGCDAVVHAASVYSLDPRRAAVMQQTNLTGTDTVLGAAYRQELDPIVYVSSAAAFWPITAAVLTAEAPVGTGIGPYSRSKIAAEQVARSYQQTGAPVVITYPAAQRLGFTLDDVADLLETGQHHHGQPPHAGLQEHARAKLAEVDAKIADLYTIRAALEAALEAGCQDLIACAGIPSCPLPFAGLADQDPE